MPEITAPTLGRQFRDRRMELELTQVDLANLTGISRPTIRGIEADRNVLPASLFRTARALGCSLTEPDDDYPRGRLIPDDAPSGGATATLDLGRSRLTREQEIRDLALGHAIAWVGHHWIGGTRDEDGILAVADTLAVYIAEGRVPVSAPGVADD
jgi:transcriptional regulator with XRE-family HTH domain